MFDRFFCFQGRLATRLPAWEASAARDADKANTDGSQASPSKGGQTGLRNLLLGLAFIWSASLGFAGTIYYVATNGSSANTGLSTNSPWPFSYALLNVPASNAIVVLPGNYTNLVIVRRSYTTLKSQIKWGARILGSGGGNNAGISVWPSPVDHVTIDGFEVANSGKCGIGIYGSNITVRNCWIHDSGQGQNVNNGSAIMSILPYYNILIENNLLENNGYSLGYDHGIYVAGTNCVLRGNVCRGNKGLGISVYNGKGASDNCQLYGNLLYGNYSGTNHPSDWQLGVNNYVTQGTTNYVFGNTIIATNASAIYTHYGTVFFTNNIIISTGKGIETQVPSTVIGDHNLAPQSLATVGPHDVITNNYGFVGTPHGLYWLSISSAARGAAKNTIYGAVDFFGNTQWSVSDIGAFQYNAAYSSDPRVLDPSPVNPDYWAPLRLMLPAGNLRVLIRP